MKKNKICKVDVSIFYYKFCSINRLYNFFCFFVFVENAIIIIFKINQEVQI